MRIQILKNGSLKKIIGTKYFEITDDYIFRLYYGKEKYIIIIPVSFLSDFGSIPAIFFNFDKTRYISYLLHDYLYSYIGKIMLDTNDTELLRGELGEMVYDQEFADDILISGLETEGMNRAGRKTIALGLFIGGRFCFKTKKKKISRLKRQIQIQKEHNLIY